MTMVKERSDAQSFYLTEIWLGFPHNCQQTPNVEL
jgi:hypothetical protein